MRVRDGLAGGERHRGGGGLAARRAARRARVPQRHAGARALAARRQLQGARDQAERHAIQLVTCPLQVFQLPQAAISKRLLVYYVPRRNFTFTHTRGVLSPMVYRMRQVSG